MGISLEKLLRQLGINPGDIAVDVPAGRTPFYGFHSEDTEGTQSFSVPSGTNLDQRTSFVVGSVIVDNNSSAWINVPDATKDGTGRFVGPGQGAAFPILGHISRARISWSAPPGKVQPAIVAGEQAQVVFAASPSPPGFGFAQPSFQLSRGSPFPVLSRAIGTYTFDIPLQTFGKGIIVYISVSAGAGNVTVTIFNVGVSGNLATQVLVSTALSASAALRVYPGIAVAPNVTASDVIGPTPRIQAVVATGPLTFGIDYDLVP